MSFEAKLAGGCELFILGMVLPDYAVDQAKTAEILGRRFAFIFCDEEFIKHIASGWLIGFISKQDASQRMMMCPNPTFLLRFSDTQTGAVSIGFVCEEDGVKGFYFN